MAAGTEGLNRARGELVQKRLGDMRAVAVTGAEKENPLPRMRAPPLFDLLFSHCETPPCAERDPAELDLDERVREGGRSSVGR
jgi:hypothetical protein